MAIVIAAIDRRNEMAAAVVFKELLCDGLTCRIRIKIFATYQSIGRANSIGITLEVEVRAAVAGDILCNSIRQEDSFEKVGTTVRLFIMPELNVPKLFKRTKFFMMRAKSRVVDVM